MGEHHHNHNRRSPKEIKKEKILKNTARLLLISAVLVLIPYLVIELYPFLKLIYVNRQINMTTICYTLLRGALLGIPILVVTPESFYKKYVPFSKIDLLSKWFALTSLLYFTGLVADIISYNVFGGYEDLGNDPVLIKMLWGNIGINGLLFCALQCAGYLVLWKIIKKHKKDVVIAFATVYALYLLCPIIHGFVTYDLLASQGRQEWLDKNIWFFISNALLVTGIAVAAKKRSIWSELIWK